MQPIAYYASHNKLREKLVKRSFQLMLETGLLETGLLENPRKITLIGSCCFNFQSFRTQTRIGVFWISKLIETSSSYYYYIYILICKRLRTVLNIICLRKEPEVGCRNFRRKLLTNNFTSYILLTTAQDILLMKNIDRSMTQKTG